MLLIHAVEKVYAIHKTSQSQLCEKFEEKMVWGQLAETPVNNVASKEIWNHFEIL